MSSTETISSVATNRHWDRAWFLALFTIVYNLVEGIVSISFGMSDEALTLFGFGVDSFIEVISAIGIAHMVLRLRTHGEDRRDEFERTALRITGGSFYALAATLVVTAIGSIYTAHVPETTIPGVIISLVSITFMWWLIRSKTQVGTELGSAPIIADANCSKVCLRMSLVVLGASVLHQIVPVPYVDAAGAVWLAWYSWKEGREAFEKSRSNANCSCDHC